MIKCILSFILGCFIGITMMCCLFMAREENNYEEDKKNK